MAHRILIVDDAAFMRMMIKDILVKNGFEVVAEAENGAQAVEKYMTLLLWISRCQKWMVLQH